MTGRELQQTLVRADLGRLVDDPRRVARAVVSFSGSALFRVPFTVIAIGGLTIRAIRTNTTSGELPQRVLQRVGFAPRDLLLFGWHRLISSAMFTHGGVEFWGGLFMIGLAVGFTEWISGTVRAFATFWGVHLVTLLAESLLIALPLQLAGLHFGTQLSDIRDVGPSAGYFGALGLACALLPRPWRYVAAAGVLGYLLATAAMPPEPGEVLALKLSADLAHLIAFPLGWLTLSLWPRRLAGSLPSVEPAPIPTMTPAASPALAATDAIAVVDPD